MSLLRKDEGGNRHLEDLKVSVPYCQNHTNHNATPVTVEGKAEGEQPPRQIPLGIRVGVGRGQWTEESGVQRPGP